MLNRVSVISRIVLLAYLAGLGLCCFWNFNSSIDLGISWLGLPMDKIAHFALFLPFPIICYMAFPELRSTKKRFFTFVSVVFLAGLMTGLSIELIQNFTEYRSGDGMDLVADGIGLCTSSLCLIIYELFRIRSRKSGDTLENTAQNE